MLHIGKNTRSTIISKGISAGYGRNTYRGRVHIHKGATGARNYSQCDSLLLGSTCAAFTFPDIVVQDPTAQMEHEASTSKIGDEQLFYCQTRGITPEDATNMIVNGFCKQVFLKLPMEFAVEAQKLTGVFMAFQYPVEIPGVSNAYFLKAALNAIRKYHGQDEIDAMDFVTLVQDKAKLLGLDETFMKRGLNEGFSGGEKKKNEVFQMAVLEPKFCVLDETDSGLDIDALRLVANGINAMRSPKRAMLVVTHYQRLLDYVVPDVVHVLVDGKIVKSGDADLARNLEKHGYGWILEEAPRPAPARP